MQQRNFYRASLAKLFNTILFVQVGVCKCVATVPGAAVGHSYYSLSLAHSLKHLLHQLTYGPCVNLISLVEPLSSEQPVTMTKPTIYYFPIRGRVEVMKLALEYGKVGCNIRNSLILYQLLTLCAYLSTNWPGGLRSPTHRLSDDEGLCVCVLVLTIAMIWMHPETSGPKPVIFCKHTSLTILLLGPSKHEILRGRRRTRRCGRNYVVQTDKPVADTNPISPIYT